jgi:uncharacterized protein (TIGR02117 family)
VLARRKVTRIATLLALGWFLQGCAAWPISPEGSTACRSPRTLFVVSHGWHTGVVVERKDLVKLLPPLAGDIGEEGHVEVGWGEERFYQARETTVGMALRAMIQRNSSVLQVVPLASPVRDYFRQSEVTEILVEEQGYRAALAFVAESFTRTSAQGVIRLSPSLYGSGWFYRAEGSFHALNTCNTWAARAIDKAGPQCEAR